jgi:O-antigen biosynthesis protein
MNLSTFFSSFHLRQVRREKLKSLLASSIFFDPVYYLDKYPDVQQKGWQALDHYLSHGSQEGRNPNPFFDSPYYCHEANLTKAHSIFPLLHYLEVGIRLQLRTSPHFDPSYYLTQHPELATSGLAPLEYYLRHGRQLGHRPSAHLSDLPLPSTVQKSHTQKLQEQLQNFFNKKETISFPQHDHPIVSILLVLHNRAELTLHCLRSILRTCHLPYEILIVDNQSTDQTSLLLNKIHNCHLISNQENIGYLRAANQAASLARGQNLLFLNNDTELQPNSVQQALQTLTSSPHVGAVGGRIISLDGTLQEAGAMLWRNGETQGYGRGLKVDAPEFMFQRDVDYCSGCFLLTPSLLFQKHGPFQDCYHFGYYEEVDYCLSLQKAAFRIVYEPRASLIHYEHGSSSGHVAHLLSQKSSVVFRKKYQAQLRQLPQPNPQLQLKRRYAASSQNNQHYLVIDQPLLSSNPQASISATLVFLQKRAEKNIPTTFYPLTPDNRTWEEIYSILPHNIEYIRDGSLTQLPLFMQKRAPLYSHIIYGNQDLSESVTQACRNLKKIKPQLLPSQNHPVL